LFRQASNLFIDMDINPPSDSSRWRLLAAGTAATFVAFAIIFLVLRMLPAPSAAFAAPTLIAIAAAFVVGYRLTTRHQTLVAWVLSSLIVPAAYIVCARLLLADARNGWGAVAYLFGTSYPVIAGTVGVLFGHFVNRKLRHDA
jgi:hypothetical protein